MEKFNLLSINSVAANSLSSNKEEKETKNSKETSNNDFLNILQNISNNQIEGLQIEDKEIHGAIYLAKEKLSFVIKKEQVINSFRSKATLKDLKELVKIAEENGLNLSNISIEIDDTLIEKIEKNDKNETFLKNQKPIVKDIQNKEVINETPEINKNDLKQLINDVPKKITPKKTSMIKEQVAIQDKIPQEQEKIAEELKQIKSEKVEIKEEKVKTFNDLIQNTPLVQKKERKNIIQDLKTEPKTKKITEENIEPKTIKEQTVNSDKPQQVKSEQVVKTEQLVKNEKAEIKEEKKPNENIAKDLKSEKIQTPKENIIEAQKPQETKDLEIQPKTIKEQTINSDKPQPVKSEQVVKTEQLVKNEKVEIKEVKKPNENIAKDLKSEKIQTPKENIIEAQKPQETKDLEIQPKEIKNIIQDLKTEPKTKKITEENIEPKTIKEQTVNSDKPQQVKSEQVVKTEQLVKNEKAEIKEEKKPNENIAKDLKSEKIQTPKENIIEAQKPQETKDLEIQPKEIKNIIQDLKTEPKTKKITEENIEPKTIKEQTVNSDKPQPVKSEQLVKTEQLVKNEKAEIKEEKKPNENIAKDLKSEKIQTPKENIIEAQKPQKTKELKENKTEEIVVKDSKTDKKIEPKKRISKIFEDLKIQKEETSNQQTQEISPKTVQQELPKEKINTFTDLIRVTPKKTQKKEKIETSKQESIIDTNIEVKTISNEEIQIPKQKEYTNSLKTTYMEKEVKENITNNINEPLKTEQKQKQPLETKKVVQNEIKIANKNFTQTTIETKIIDLPKINDLERNKPISIDTQTTISTPKITKTVLPLMEETKQTDKKTEPLINLETTPQAKTQKKVVDITSIFKEIKKETIYKQPMTIYAFRELRQKEVEKFEQPLSAIFSTINEGEEFKPTIVQAVQNITTETKTLFSNTLNTPQTFQTKESETTIETFQNKNSSQNDEVSNNFLRDLTNITQSSKKEVSKKTISSFTSTLDEQIKNYKAPLMKVTLNLNPQNLGSVEVILKQRGKNLQININSNQNALLIFQQYSNDFKSSMFNLGFENIGMDFASNEKSFNQNNQSGQNNQEQQKQNETLKEFIDDEDLDSIKEIPQDLTLTIYG